MCRQDKAAKAWSQPISATCAPRAAPDQVRGDASGPDLPPAHIRPALTSPRRFAHHPRRQIFKGAPMSNPVLVEVTRGREVESRHRGAAVVMDADGAVVFSIGDIERRVFPRSAVKAIQALPLVESGIADRLGLTAPRSRCAAHPIPASRSMWRAPPRCSPKRAATPPASNAARTGRWARRPRARSRWKAAGPAPCTTTAPASIPASSASPAGSRRTRRATSSPATACSARSGARWRP